MTYRWKRVYTMIVLLATILISIVSIIKIYAATARVQVEVVLGNVSIAATGTLDLGSITTALTTGTISGQYTSIAFRVIDFKWRTGGYTTTIQSTDLTGNIWETNYSIPAANVYLKTAGNPIFMSWQANPHVTFWWVQSGTYTSLWSAQVYFIKDNLGQTGGIYSTYGDRPWIRVDIPAFQAATSYQGTITFTLTES